MEVKERRIKSTHLLGLAVLHGAHNFTFEYAANKVAIAWAAFFRSFVFLLCLPLIIFHNEKRALSYLNPTL